VLRKKIFLFRNGKISLGCYESKDFFVSNIRRTFLHGQNEKFFRFRVTDRHSDGIAAAKNDKTLAI